MASAVGYSIKPTTGSRESGWDVLGWGGYSFAPCLRRRSYRPIIADLIEIGVDVLNPIQRNCPGLHPLELKKEFGSDLIFMEGLTPRMFYLMAQSIKYAKRRSNCLKE